MTRAEISVVHRARVAVLVSFGLALFACGGDKPTGPTPRPKVTVLVTRSPGVARNAPGSDSLVVDSGTAVTYSFSSASGYRNLLVTLNDQEVAPSGSFAAVRASRLLAVADSVVTLQASDSGLLAASRALARAADPYQAYQAYQALSESLRTAVGATVAAHRLRVAIAEALDPVLDAPALASLARIVAESMSVRPAAQRVPRLPPAAADARDQVVFLYVNGISDESYKFEITQDGRIKDMVAAAGFSDPALYAVSGFYNPTTKFLSSEMLAAWTCYRLKANELVLGLFSRWWGTPACNVGEVHDLAESVLQVTNAVLGRAPDAQQPDVLAFADSIRRVLSRGSRVVLIAHSQGNLYAQQALMHMRLDSLAPLGCVGVVGIAPPTSAGWPVGTSSVGQLMAVGLLSSDILYQLPLPHALGVHVRTAKTDLFDRWLALGLLSPPAFSVLSLLFGIEIHDLENYDDDGTGRAAIVSDIRNQASQTELSCPITPPPAGRGFDPATFTATFYNGTDLTGTSFIRPYTEPIDFLRTCWDESPPFAGCKLVEQLDDGNDYSVQWTGRLLVPANGEYVFIFANVDDGARLFLDGTEGADNGWYWPAPDRRPSPRRISLTAGWHDIRIDYEQRVPGAASLQVRWSGPGFAEEVIPLAGTTQLAFSVQPTTTTAGATITPAVQVTARDAQGNTAPGFTGSVTVAIGTNPSGGTLSGTTTVAAVAGVATFGNLSINTAGAGYTLTAAASGLAGATSAAFSIIQPSGITVMVLSLVYDPVVDGQGRRLSAAMGWNDPAQLTSRLISDFRTASHGVANYQLVETVLRDWSPQNGGQYTYQTYLEDYQGGTCRFSFPAPYETIISENNLAQRVQTGEIDEVWMWGYPCGNWYESRMTGSGAYWVNAPPLTSVSGRPFILMGYNFERGLAEAAESYGHRAESIVRRVYGFDSWQPNEAHDWNKFTLLDRDVPGRGGIGDAHNAFNAESGTDYNRTSLRTVPTSADDWANFPNLTGARRDANCTEWNCDGYQYLLWWYSHMPHMVGSTSGVLNDWWQYILRPGEAIPCSDPQRGCRETAPTQLVFTVQPTTTTAGATITPAVQVTARDAQGNTDTRYTGSVTVALGTNPSGGTLSGTTSVAAVAGVATFGNLSINTAGAGYTLFAAALGLTGATSAAFTITPPPAGLTFAAVSAGGDHTCGVTTSGAAYCWGVNSYGELGDGTIDTTRTTPVLVSGGLSFAAVDAGANHTCGVTTSGVAYCWGDNSYGQLGDGTMTDRATPELVSGGLSFAVVNAERDHTCGVTTSGVAYCWGWNFFGQLGDGTTTDRTTPGLVSGTRAFTTISAGNQHTCGVTTSGVAYCWGDNGSGQLGDGTTTDRTTPGLVSGGLTFAAVDAGYHTCGVSTSDAAYCWGYNWFGQLGDGTIFTIRTTPGLVSGGLTFAAVDAGYDHTCGVTTSGVAYCWGWNFSGQLGDGTATDRTTPRLVAGGHTFAAVSAAYNHTCGVTTSGVGYCWGSNYNGQLGDGTRIDRLVPVPVVQ